MLQFGRRARDMSWTSYVDPSQSELVAMHTCGLAGAGFAVAFA